VPNTHTLATLSCPTGHNDAVQQPSTGPVVFHDADTGLTRSILSAEDIVPLVELSPDGRSVLVRTGPDFDNGPMRIYDALSGKLRTTLPPDHLFHGEPARFSPDGRWLAYADWREKTGVRIWDTTLDREQAAPDGVMPPWAFSPDSRWLAYGVREGKHSPTRVVVWDVRSVQTVRSLPLPSGRDLSDLRFSPNGEVLVTRSEDFSKRAGPGSPPANVLYYGWEVATGRERFRRAETGLTFFPLQAPWFAIDDDRGPLRRFTFATGNECGHYDHPPVNAEMWDSGMSPDGRCLASGTYEYSRLMLWLNDNVLKRPQEQFIRERVKIADVENGRMLAILPAEFDWKRRDGGERMLFSSDSSMFGLMTDADIEIWDIPPRKPLTWFALAAAVLALPLAGLAWRRSRRLRREVA
jgi:WD40 repeat protein